MAQPKKIQSVCIPLDPDDCGSVIHGYVRYPELTQRNYGKKLWDIEFSASLSLSDCNRVINWNMNSGDEFNVAKLDVAISALTEFRKFMVEANAEIQRVEKERAKLNKELDPEWVKD